jgi:two-component system phosphate regulon sensor histidine kinase PhoR
VKSIRTKIAITYIALAILLVTGVSIISSVKIESYFTQRLVDDMSREIDVIQFYLSDDSSASREQINERIRHIAGIEVRRVTLIDRDGNVIADSDVPTDRLPSLENHLHRPEIQQALAKPVGIDSRHSATVGRDFLYVARKVNPILNNGILQNLQFIRLSMPLEEVQSRSNEIHLTIIGAGILVLLLVVAFSMVVSRRISRPMVEIARSVQRIRTGNLDEHIVVSSDDEIGQVATAVNELVDTLKSDMLRLNKLERVRSEFLGNVSHELRTPIFALQGMLETLLNGALDDPTVNRSFLEKAQSNATRLNVLLTDLINISQIESGEMRMSFRYFPINEFLEAAARDVYHLAAQRRISVSLNVQSDAATQVYGDRDRLRQVMDNLIDNAIKYNTVGGTVTIISKEDVRSVEINIVDTGVGISPEHVPRVFERFYRVDKDRSREVGGTGLGLAIVKHILEAHDSTIEVESTTGKGSTFRFALKKG